MISAAPVIGVAAAFQEESAVTCPARRPGIMHRYRWLGALLLVGVGALALSLIRGQGRPDSGLPARGPVERATTAATPAPLVKPAAGARDLSRLSPAQQQFLLAGQRGADWLFRMNGIEGRFLHGYLPALKQELEGDHY